MPALQPVRGTQDLLPDAARRHRQVSETARALVALYGFDEIATPISSRRRCIRSKIAAVRN
jgi:histidyl-tRNA synthetase